jgi:hypothetical protein
MLPANLGGESPLPPELGFFRVAAGRELAVPQHGAVFEELLARFLAELRWPLPDWPGLQRFAGEDDRFARHGYFQHLAVDLGSRLVDENGDFHVLPAWTMTQPAHAELRHHAGAVTVRGSDHLLRVGLASHHVDADDQLGRLGRLEPFAPDLPLGGWRTSDPYLRLLGAPKGNHVHLVVRGLFEDQPERRTELMNWRLLPALLAAPGRGVDPAATPLPVPPPGDGADEKRDPRGAAILRAQLWQLRRQLQPLLVAGNAEVITLPRLDSAGPWLLEWRVEPGTVVQPPVRGAPGGSLPERLAPQSWRQVVTPVAASRVLEVVLLTEGVLAEADTWRCPSGRLRVVVEGRVPHGAAWLCAYAAPVWRGASEE